jgi:hypothetical protein
MNQKHTPGPWYVGTDFSDQGRHIYAEQMVCDDDGEEWHPLIATTDDDERLVDWQANAQLLAAAPDLLEALKNADKLISQLMPGIKHIALQDYAFLNNTLMANTAAIAKATGGQP